MQLSGLGTAASIAVLLLLITGLVGLVLQLLKKDSRLSRSTLAALVLVGLLGSLTCLWIQSVFWGWTGLELTSRADNASGALIAMLAFAVPLEEASKLVAVWPLYQRRRLKNRAEGFLAATFVAAGFGAAEGVHYLLTNSELRLLPLRVCLGALAHVFFAGSWGYVLGDARGRWLRGVWLSAVFFHGLFDHIVYGRGIGTLVLAAPMLMLMLVVGGFGLRETARTPHGSVPSTVRLSRPSLQIFTDVVRDREQPLMLRWVVVGAFVTTGTVLVALGLAIYTGHQIGVDFAAADESDVSANAPLFLLGAALLAAFPLSGYLVARASGLDSVLEPALGAALAIVVFIVLVSMATPVAVVFGLSVAPVAFGLACVGAWFGIGR